MKTIEDFARKWGTKGPGLILRELTATVPPRPQVISAMSEMITDLEFVLKEVNKS